MDIEHVQVELGRRGPITANYGPPLGRARSPAPRPADRRLYDRTADDITVEDIERIKV